jgi:hypothetical protein
MRGISGLAALHLLCLVLCAPLILIYVNSSGSADLHSERWALFASALIYGVVIATNRPKSIYDGALKFGLERRVLKCALASVMLIMLSVPLMDSTNEAVSIIGLGCLIAAAAVFMFAVKVKLWRSE